jgi:hypothetical protein
MFSYKISRYFWYLSNNTTLAVVQGNTLEVYNLSPLKILWDFGVVCLNLPYIKTPSKKKPHNLNHGAIALRANNS